MTVDVPLGTQGESALQAHLLRRTGTHAPTAEIRPQSRIRCKRLRAVFQLGVPFAAK